MLKFLWRLLVIIATSIGEVLHSVIGWILAIPLIPLITMFVYEMRKIEMSLPTVWSTKNEIENHILERHKKILQKWSRFWSITSLLLVNDEIKREAISRIASRLSGANKKDFLLVMTLDSLIDSLFEDSELHRPNIAVADAYFFPAGTPIELRETGGTTIGRSFVIPCASLDPEEYEAALAGHSVSLSFIRRRGRGKKRRPPMETSRKMVPILTN